MHAQTANISKRLRTQTSNPKILQAVERIGHITSIRFCSHASMMMTGLFMLVMLHQGVPLKACIAIPTGIRNTDNMTLSTLLLRTSRCAENNSHATSTLNTRIGNAFVAYPSQCQAFTPACASRAIAAGWVKTGLGRMLNELLRQHGYGHRDALSNSRNICATNKKLTLHLCYKHELNTTF